MTDHIFFYFGLSFIIMHEMDAIRCKEWRIFPGLSLLNDKWGSILFILAHIPLFGFLFWGIFGQEDKTDLIWGLNIFFIIHVGLHLLFLLHKKNEFRDGISWILISGAGLFAMMDLLF